LLRRRGLDTPQRGAEESDRLERDQPWLSEVIPLQSVDVSRLAQRPAAGLRLAVTMLIPKASTVLPVHGAPPFTTFVPGLRVWSSLFLAQP